MAKLLILLGLSIAVFAQDELSARKPVYKYRYETEDVMKTAASTIPVRGYHVVEGGYYPAEIGLAGAGGGVGIGGVGGGIGGAGLVGGGYGGAGLGGAGIGLGYGGGIGLGGAGIGYGAGKFIGGGAGLGGAGLGGAGLGGAGLIGAGGAGKFIAAPGLIGGGAGLVGTGGGGLYGGGAGLYGGHGLIGAGGAGLYGGGAGLYGGHGLVGAGGAGLVGAGGAGLVGAGGAGLYGGGAGIVGGPLLHRGYGGEVIDKNVYSGGDKKLQDEVYEKASGNKGEEFNAGKQGYTKGIAAVKNNKGESGFYNDASAGKKIAEDGKTYYGGQHFDKEGKQGGEFTEKKGHKKGHKIKGFKSSHHKDETGKTEEYYDEENDEGGKINFSGQSGSFGEKGASSYKGGHENGEFAEKAHKKEGHFVNEHLVDHNNADQGGYGQKKYGGSGVTYGVNNGVDQHSLLGHQENSKVYKHVPFY